MSRQGPEPRRTGGARRTAAVASLILTTFVSPLPPGRAQEATSGGTAREDPRPTDLVERVEVRVRQVNFLALDSRGNPVTDLRPDEIEVRESGVLQKVAFLDRYRPAPVVATAPEVPSPAPEAEAGAAGEAVAALPSDAAAKRARGRWLILFFDNYLTEPLTRSRALEASREFLDQRVEPTDLVQVVVFDGKLKIVQPFTNNRVLLDAAMSEVAALMDHVAGDRYNDLDSLMDALDVCREKSSPSVCAGSRASTYENDRWREADALLRAVLQVVRSVKPVPDVKALVMFTNGFARNPAAEARDAVQMILGLRAAQNLMLRESGRLDELYDELAVEAADARVSIFPINPGARRMTAISADRKGWYDERAIDASLGDIYSRGDQNFQAGVEELSRRTGGRATRSNDVLGSLNKAFDVTAGLYSVGYRPDPEGPGAAWVKGKTKIKILRRGVKAVLPDDVPRSPVRAPLGGDLTLAGEACENGRRLVTLRLRLDLASLEFERVEQEVINNFALFLRLSDGETGDLFDRDFRYFNVTYPRERFDARELPDPTIEQQMLVPCRPLVVEITAADSNSGARRTFSQTLPI